MKSLIFIVSALISVILAVTLCKEPDVTHWFLLGMSVVFVSTAGICEEIWLDA